MGKRGPRPKPTRLRLLQGNAAKRRLPKNEPQPPAADPLEVPDYLEGLAREKWEIVAPRLAALKLLTELDVDMLAAYCLTYGDWRLVRAAMKTLSAAEIITLGIAKREKEIKTSLRQLASEFGFSPATRSRVSAAGGLEPERDPMEEFLGGGGSAPRT